ncbi:tripartite motif-containing protein 2-like [Anneissia japonica]|uniref:tripartite motif-containing protein 2-like n=1 Tax=Anneissia japonica TaxID=1529436 RepID=UPI0014258EBC|nr:tripartite motif-containing protein 2-like [Anneissia japonica]
MTMSMETGEKANAAYFADLKLVVSKWYDDHIPINMLKVLFRDYVLDTIALHTSSKTMDLINMLVGSGELGPTDLTLLYDTIKATRQFGLVQEIKKQISSFQILENIRDDAITKFTVHRQRLIKLGMVLTPGDVETISGLYEEKHTDSWSLIMNLEHKRIICEQNMDVFIRKLKQYELYQAVGALTEESQGATGMVHHGFHHSAKISKMPAGKVLHTLQGGKDEHIFCPIHCNNVLEFFCSTCKKSACKHCEHGFYCLRNKHDVIELKTVVYDVTIKPKEIQKKLEEKLVSIAKDRSHLESHRKLCRAAIEEKEMNLIIKIQKKSQQLLSDLEKIYKEMQEDIDSQVKDINEKLTRVNNVTTSISTRMSKPQEIETIVSYMTTINTFSDLNESFDESNITPKFIDSTQLDDLMNTDGIGKITTVHGMYKVDKDDEVITVTKGQPLVVAVSSLAESDRCKLAGTLIKNSSGEESPTEVEYQGNGKYKITGKCNVEGDWQMKITAGEAHIKGSPVNITVEKLGLVHTIFNIPDYKEHRQGAKVSDVVLDTDECILVSSFSKDILKFNQSGSFVGRIKVQQNVQVNRMHLMSDGNMVYSDFLQKCVVMCDDNFKEIRSFGKGILKEPKGLAVNKKRVLYVADQDAYCVFKFNVDDGRLLDKIAGSKVSKVGQMYQPQDVTLTREDHVIVADINGGIQMFDANDKLMKVVIGQGKEDGKVRGPCGVIMDMDENIIASSNHKLQLFDKNGVFVERIDHEDDVFVPLGITVISNRPRRVAVANHGENTVKIFNY